MQRKRKYPSVVQKEPGSKIVPINEFKKPISLDKCNRPRGYILGGERHTTKSIQLFSEDSASPEDYQIAEPFENTIEEEEAVPVKCPMCTLINAPYTVFCAACRTRIKPPSWSPKRNDHYWNDHAWDIKKQQGLILKYSSCKNVEKLPIDSEIDTRVIIARKNIRNMSLNIEEINQGAEEIDQGSKGRRALIRLGMFGSTHKTMFQKMTLRDHCLVFLMEICTDVEDCLNMLNNLSQVLFDCPELQNHCLSVIQENFTSSIYSLYLNPRTKVKDSNVSVNRNMVIKLGSDHHCGKEHIVLSYFDLFLSIPKYLQYVILDMVWKDLKKRTKDEKLLSKAVDIGLQGLRFFNFCLWIGKQHDENPMIENITSTITYPITVDIKPFYDELRKSIVEKKDVTTKGKECMRETVEEKKQLKLEWISLDICTVAFFYKKAFTMNLFSLEAFLERYIKSRWVIMIGKQMWKSLIPIDRREMLTEEYHCEMIEYYQKSINGQDSIRSVSQEGEKEHTTEQLMDEFIWSNSEGEMDQWNFVEGDDIEWRECVESVCVEIVKK
ncbi:MAG: hypothetical protein ACTSUE_25235 [Promethearchaeota archaeon]